MCTLLIHHGALGDWVLTWPLMRALAAPRRTLLAGQSPGKAALAARLLDHVTPLATDGPAWASLFREVDHLPDVVARPLAQADRVISFVSDGHDTWARQARSAAPQAAFHFVSPRPRSCDHTTPDIPSWHAQQLARQGLAISPINPAERQATHRPDAPLWCHPGSGGKDKCWPWSQWQTVLDHARNQGWPLRPIVGEVELATWPADRLRDWQTRHGLVICHTLDDLADRLSDARGFIGHDAGPTHLSAAMGLPTLALFGPTWPNVWSPWGPQVNVIAPPAPRPMDWLAPSQVIDAVGVMMSLAD